MGTLTITFESVNKLFGLKQKIENDMGISLSYHTGMILGKTRFYKQGACWLIISDKGELSLDGRFAGIIKNKCAPEEGTAVIATITSAKECSRAVAGNKESKDAEIFFIKEGKRIATAKGTHNSLRIDFDYHDDLWIVLVLGWCALDYVFMRAWDKTAYFDPEPEKPKEEGKPKKGIL